jgi:hypothetical protein
VIGIDDELNKPATGKNFGEALDERGGKPLAVFRWIIRE